MYTAASPNDLAIDNVALRNPTNPHRIKKITPTKIGNSFREKIKNFKKNKKSNNECHRDENE